MDISSLSPEILESLAIALQQGTSPTELLSQILHTPEPFEDAPTVLVVEEPAVPQLSLEDVVPQEEQEVSTFPDVVPQEEQDAPVVVHIVPVEEAVVAVKDVVVPQEEEDVPVVPEEEPAVPAMADVVVPEEKDVPAVPAMADVVVPEEKDVPAVVAVADVVLQEEKDEPAVVAVADVVLQEEKDVPSVPSMADVVSEEEKEMPVVPAMADVVVPQEEEDVPVVPAMADVVMPQEEEEEDVPAEAEEEPFVFVPSKLSMAQQRALLAQVQARSPPQLQQLQQHQALPKPNRVHHTNLSKNDLVNLYTKKNLSRPTMSRMVSPPVEPQSNEEIAQQQIEFQKFKRALGHHKKQNYPVPKLQEEVYFNMVQKNLQRPLLMPPVAMSYSKAQMFAEQKLKHLTQAVPPKLVIPVVNPPSTMQDRVTLLQQQHHQKKQLLANQRLVGSSNMSMSHHELRRRANEMRQILAAAKKK